MLKHQFRSHFIEVFRLRFAPLDFKNALFDSKRLASRLGNTLIVTVGSDRFCFMSSSQTPFNIIRIKVLFINIARRSIFDVVIVLNLFLHLDCAPLSAYGRKVGAKDIIVLFRDVMATYIDFIFSYGSYFLLGSYLIPSVNVIVIALRRQSLYSIAVDSKKIPFVSLRAIIFDSNVHYIYKEYWSRRPFLDISVIDARGILLRTHCESLYDRSSALLSYVSFGSKGKKLIYCSFVRSIVGVYRISKLLLIAGEKRLGLSKLSRRSLLKRILYDVANSARNGKIIGSYDYDVIFRSYCFYTEAKRVASALVCT